MNEKVIHWFGEAFGPGQERLAYTGLYVDHPKRTLIVCGVRSNVMGYIDMRSILYSNKHPLEMPDTYLKKGDQPSPLIGIRSCVEVSTLEPYYKTKVGAVEERQRSNAHVGCMHFKKFNGFLIVLIFESGGGGFAGFQVF